MPLAVAEYLRHLATRCSRMSRDCSDQVTAKELVQISVELVEKAETLETYFSIAEPAGNPDEPFSTETVTVSGKDQKS